jgi:hypothetical protein
MYPGDWRSYADASSEIARLGAEIEVRLHEWRVQRLERKICRLPIDSWSQPKLHRRRQRAEKRLGYAKQRAQAPRRPHSK